MCTLGIIHTNGRKKYDTNFFTDEVSQLHLKEISW